MSPVFNKSLNAICVWFDSGHAKQASYACIGSSNADHTGATQRLILSTGCVEEC